MCCQSLVRESCPYRAWKEGRWATLSGGREWIWWLDNISLSTSSGGETHLLVMLLEICSGCFSSPRITTASLLCGYHPAILVSVVTFSMLPNCKALTTEWCQPLNSELQIGDTDKPLKLMSAWKQLMTQYSSVRNKSSGEDVPTFQLRRNIFIPLSKEKLVSIKFINQDILSGSSLPILIGDWPLVTTTTVCWCKQFIIMFMLN